MNPMQSPEFSPSLAAHTDYQLNYVKDEVSSYHELKLTSGNYVLTLQKDNDLPLYPGPLSISRDYRHATQIDITGKLTDRSNYTDVTIFYCWIETLPSGIEKFHYQTTDPAEKKNPLNSWPLNSTQPKLSISLTTDGGGLVVIGTLDGLGDLEPEPLRWGYGVPSTVPLTNVGNYQGNFGPTIIFHVGMEAQIDIPFDSHIVLDTPLELPTNPLNALRFYARTSEESSDQFLVWQEKGDDDFYYLAVEEMGGAVVTNIPAYRIDPRWTELSIGLGHEDGPEGQEILSILYVNGEYPLIG